MIKRTRNRATKYDLAVTIRVNSWKFESFKRMCNSKGKKYNEVIRDLIDLYLRQNS